MIHLSPTYLRDSTQVLDELAALSPLPANARLFSIDAVSMYTNIDTEPALSIFTKWLTEFPTELTNMKPTLFLPVLKLVMQRNVFQFDNTYWHQMDGTAMGTSTACLYAALYYAYHEKRQLIPKYGHRLLYFKRFINDGLGIWLGEADAEWDSFINEVDNFGKLRWTNTGLMTEVDFLDLTIQIDDHRNVRTKTFCKPMNLFLYIPPRSAHPPGVLRSTILGNLSRFY